MSARLQAFRFKAMGCPCALQLYAESPRRARHWAAAARGEIARLERKYSRYRGDSIVGRINAGAGDAPVRVDPETTSLLDYAETCFRQSEGRFDITSGILRRAWDFRSERLPHQDAIDALLPHVGWQRVEWCAPEIRLPDTGMQIDLGGFVKEYAADRVAQLLREAGCQSGIVDLGGDLAVIGPHPGGAPWRVGVRDANAPDRPAGLVPVTSGGVATSGDYERCMVVDGVRYGHVLDPRTGWPIESLASVTVFASRCLIAGTASTIALLQGESAARWLDDLGLPHTRQAHGGPVEAHLGDTSADAA